MIVVCGQIHAPGSRPGLVAAIAERAAAAVDRAGTVQVVGVVPDDADGDRSLQALAAGGVGHAAAMRGAARPLEPGDVDLAVRYLPDVRVTVGVDLSPDSSAALVAAAGFAGASSVVVVSPATGIAGSPEDHDGSAPATFVLQAPTSDADDTFAGFVAMLAVRLDAGDEPSIAWNATVRDLAVDAV